MDFFNQGTPICPGRYPVYQRSNRLKSKLDNDDDKMMTLRSIGIKKEILNRFLDHGCPESDQFNIFYIDEFIKAYKKSLTCQCITHTIDLMKHFGRADWQGFKEDFFSKPVGAWSDDGYIFIAKCSKGRVVAGFSEGTKPEWFDK